MLYWGLIPFCVDCCAATTERLEWAPDIIICTPISSTKQLPRAVIKPAAWSGTSSGPLWAGSDLRACSYWSCAEDAYHVYRPVWTWLSPRHRALQSRSISSVLNCNVCCLCTCGWPLFPPADNICALSGDDRLEDRRKIISTLLRRYKRKAKKKQKHHMCMLYSMNHVAKYE